MDMQFFRDELDKRIQGAENDIKDAEMNLELWRARRAELPEDTPEWIIEAADDNLERWETNLVWANTQLAKWKRRREALENVEFIDRRKK